MSKQNELERRRARVRYSITQPPKQTGVSQATLHMERRALEFCMAAGHSQQTRGTVACRSCLQDVLMDRLGTVHIELPPLVGVKDPVALHLDELLRDGGRWGLAELLAKVNQRRFAEHKDPYTETACSARIRDLRKAGRHIEQQGEAGGATYWMPRPSPLSEETA